MRICQIGVIGYLSKDGNREKKTIGGIAGYVLELVETLNMENIDINFIGKIYYYYKRKNIKYYQVQDNLTSTNKFLICLFVKSFFIRLTKETIIHAHRPDHLAAFTFFKKNKSIVTLHGQQAITVYNRKGWIVRKLFKVLEIFALNKADKILVTDKITKKYYSETYPKHRSKIIVTPTGVDLKKFRKLDKQKCRSKFSYYKKDKIIQYLGRIESPKKIADMISAFAIVAQKDDNFKFMIIGDGLDLEKMKTLSMELGINDKIRFFGARMREELPELINCADVSVLYSGNEGSPLSIKESLACGVPVIANVVGDISEIVKNDINGYLLLDENVVELGRLMLECVNNVQRLSKNCIESVRQYSVDIMNKKIISIYKEVS